VKYIVALHSYLRAVEIEGIESALARNGGNVAATARELGRSRTGLILRMQTLGIERPVKTSQAGMGNETREDLSEPAPGELALRETTLYRLTEPADRLAILRVGRMLHRYALDQPPECGLAICAACQAGAKDLRNLQGFFEWLSREADETEPGRSGVALAESAHAWGEELARLAAAIEDELGLPRSGRSTNT